MKYLKTYEELEKYQDLGKYTLQDFKNIKYWRYKHDMIDCIMKIVNNNIIMLNVGEIIHPKLLFSYYNNLEEKNFIGILNSKHFILRPATKEEIEEFEKLYEKYKLEEETQKYNL